jgi:hypothetical protein
VEKLQYHKIRFFVSIASYLIIITHQNLAMNMAMELATFITYSEKT